MKNKLTIIYLILFLLLGVASIFILHHAVKHNHKPKKPTINSFIIHAKFIEYNQYGQVKIIITSIKVTHMQTLGITYFEKPRIIGYTEKNRTPWHIHADLAISNQSGSKIILRGHVIAHQLPTSLHAESTITTSELTVFPKEARAITEKKVTIVRPGTIITGTGLVANLKTGQYELHSESSAIYNINEAKKKRQ